MVPPPPPGRRPGVPAQAPRERTPLRQAVVEHIDRRIAAVAHLSIAFGVFIGVGFLLGIAINVVIWLRSRRSPFVEFHAEQAGAYQLCVLLTNILVVGLWLFNAGYLVLGGTTLQIGGWSVNYALTGIGCLLAPAFILWYLGTILYGIYGGLLIAAGRDFSYPIFGPWARRRLQKHTAR